jgi:YVTN family beta-propeller protein
MGVVRSLALAALGLCLVLPAQAGMRRHEAIGVALFESPQVDPIALSFDGTLVYVAETTANRVSVFSADTHMRVATIQVGSDPAALALRPVGGELWVSNHVSDSVSVIDVQPGSPTQFQVVDTVQDLDAAGRTAFDEPLGIAFSETGQKAFVALSSRNQIAVIDPNARTVTSRINVRAQEPRAIRVRNGLLYVAAFESGNQTQLGLCFEGDCFVDGFDLLPFALNPNLPNFEKDIFAAPAVPDRDLFVYDVATGAEVAAVSGVGTLLYGLAVDGNGRAIVTQTDARNAVNGAHGQSLVALDNRMFTNELATVSCSAGGCGAPSVLDLEGASPTHATAMATPYGVALSTDEQLLAVTLAGSSRLATFDAATLALRDVLDLGTGAEQGQQGPRGVALRTDELGAAIEAWVLNTLEDTISVVDVSNPDAIEEVATLPLLGDPTPAAVRQGRSAFNDAFASTTGTFSCASCHPDANVDQLLWRIGGECFQTGCSGDEPRITMPVRGLANTLPLHWDGTLGDPIGGVDGSVGFEGGTNPPDCDASDADGDDDCFLHLADASLGGVMCDPDPVANPAGCPPGGNLPLDRRQALAAYLESVWYPPARSRPMSDAISTPAAPVPVPNGNGTPSATTANAFTGFQDFFTRQTTQLATQPSTCADSDAGCHTLPLGVVTNSGLGGFEAPTMRGMTDRFVQFSLGITSTLELLENPGVTISAPIQWNATQGFREITTFASAFLIFTAAYNTQPLHTFQMFEEASTGHGGAVARQVMLNARTTGAGLIAATDAQLATLEEADRRGLVNLQGRGTRDGAPFAVSFRSDDTYQNGNGSVSLTRAQLVAEAQAGTLGLALTGWLRSGWGGANGRQPLLAPVGTGSNNVTGDPPLPVIPATAPSDPPAFDLVGRDVRSSAVVFLDGAPAAGATLSCSAGTSGDFCTDGIVSVDLPSKPANGLHLLQVLNPTGPISNELPFCVGAGTGCR